MEEGTKALAVKHAIHEATEKAGVQSKLAVGARALIAEEIAGRTEVEETAPGQYSVSILGDAGSTPLDEFVSAWAKTPEAAPFIGGTGPAAPTATPLDDPAEYTREFVLPRRPEGMNESGTAQVAKLADLLESELNGLRERLGEIRRDMKPEAQAGAVTRAAAKTAEKIAALQQAYIPSAEKAVSSLEAALLSPAVRHAIPSGVDPADWRAAEAELRALVRDKDPLEIETLYRDAAGRGDRQTMRALELGPSALPLISEELRAEGAELFAEATAPEKYEKLRQARYLRDTLTGNIRNAGGGFRRLTGILIDDPVPAMAGGDAG